MSGEGGYTRQYRRLWCHPAFRSKQEAAVFSWLKDAAQWRDVCMQTRYGPVRLRRGEVLIAEREVAEDFGLARNTLRSLLDRMVAMGMVALIRGDGRAPQRAGTILQVCNYDAYQLGADAGSLGAAHDAARGPQQDRTVDRDRTASEPQKNPPDQGVVGNLTEDQDRNGTAERTENGPDEDRTRTENKEGKEGKEDTGSLRSPVRAVGQQALAPVTQVATVTALPSSKPEAPKPGDGDLLPGLMPAAKADPKGHRLPADWQPSADDVAYAVERGLDAASVAEDFRDYWHAKSGQAARMVNWSLTWKRRCRDLAERRGSRPRAQAPSPALVPETANGWIVSEVVERCYDAVNVDYDGLWKNREFSLLIADALAAGKTPDHDILPLMKRLRRHPDGPSSIGPRWFRAALDIKHVGPALRVVA